MIINLFLILLPCILCSFFAGFIVYTQGYIPGVGWLMVLAFMFGIMAETLIEHI